MSGLLRDQRVRRTSALLEETSPHAGVDVQEGFTTPIISMLYGIDHSSVRSRQHAARAAPLALPGTPSSRLLSVSTTASILAGKLPRKQSRLVQAWIELHR